jgi:hypothetical protein
VWLYPGQCFGDGWPLWPTVAGDCRRHSSRATTEGVVNDGPAAGVLVAHQVAVGIPGLDGGLVAEERLKHLDRLTAADLDRGEVVPQVVRRGRPADLPGRALPGALRGIRLAAASRRHSAENVPT